MEPDQPERLQDPYAWKTRVITGEAAVVTTRSTTTTNEPAESASVAQGLIFWPAGRDVGGPMSWEMFLLIVRDVHASMH